MDARAGDGVRTSPSGAAGGWLYGFATSRIQEYVLASDRLLDVQGASHAIERLCSTVFPDVLRAVGLDPTACLVQNAAGEARVVTDDEHRLRALARVWPAVVDAEAPGLSVQQAMLRVDSSAALDDRQRTLGTMLQADRAAPFPELPEVGPLVSRSARTGLPAVDVDDQFERDERIDRSVAARRRVGRALRERDHAEPSALDARFLPSDAGATTRFVSGQPRDEAALLGRGGRYVAVLHADGNRIGRTLEALANRTHGEKGAGSSLFRSFSTGLSAATESAVRTAVRSALLPHAEDGVLPARPILLGGDDVCLVVRAALGLDFAEAFLTEFRAASARLLRDLGAPEVGPITACAGLAIVRSHHPFARAHALAEALCRRAKRLGRRPDGRTSSCVAFLRVTDDTASDPDHAAKPPTAADGSPLSLGAYAVGKDDAALPRLDDLRALELALASVPRSALHDLVAAMLLDRSSAERRWERWKEVANARGQARRVRDVEDALAALTGGGLWRVADGGGTPCLEALDLRKLRGGLDEGPADPTTETAS